jgi:mRNA interferase HicA
MERADLIRHLESHGCYFVREGSRHTVYRNPANGSSTTIPRHREIKKQLARKICLDLGISSCNQVDLIVNVECHMPSRRWGTNAAGFEAVGFGLGGAREADAVLQRYSIDPMAAAQMENAQNEIPDKRI